MSDQNVGVRVSMDVFAKRPDPTSEGLSPGDFFTATDTAHLYQLKRDPTTGVLTWIQIIT